MAEDVLKRNVQGFLRYIRDEHPDQWVKIAVPNTGSWHQAVTRFREANFGVNVELAFRETRRKGNVTVADAYLRISM